MFSQDNFNSCQKQSETENTLKRNSEACVSSQKEITDENIGHESILDQKVDQLEQKLTQFGESLSTQEKSILGKLEKEKSILGKLEKETEIAEKRVNEIQKNFEHRLKTQEQSILGKLDEETSILEKLEEETEMAEKRMNEIQKNFEHRLNLIIKSLIDVAKKLDGLDDFKNTVDRLTQQMKPLLTQCQNEAFNKELDKVMNMYEDEKASINQVDCNDN